MLKAKQLKVAVGLAVSALTIMPALAVAGVNPNVTTNTLPGNGLVVQGSPVTVSIANQAGLPTANVTTSTITNMGNGTGQATISVGGGGTVIDWGKSGSGYSDPVSGFNIGQNASLTFTQSATVSSPATVLNVDVNGQYASEINGALISSAAGDGPAPTVYVANGNGIVVGGNGAGANIVLPNGGGFLGFGGPLGTGVQLSADGSVVTLDQSQTPGNISISGSITAANQGAEVFIAGGQVTNSGQITVGTSDGNTGVLAIAAGMQPYTSPSVKSASFYVSGNGVDSSQFPEGLTTTSLTNAGAFINSGTVKMYGDNNWLGIYANAGVTNNGSIAANGTTNFYPTGVYVGNFGGTTYNNGTISSSNTMALPAVYTPGSFANAASSGAGGIVAASNPHGLAYGVMLVNNPQGGLSTLGNTSLGATSSISAPSVGIYSTGWIMGNNMNGQTYPINANVLSLESGTGGSEHGSIAAFSPTNQYGQVNYNNTGLGVGSYTGNNVTLLVGNSAAQPYVSLNVWGTANYYNMMETALGQAALSKYTGTIGTSGWAPVAGASNTQASARGGFYAPFQNGSLIGNNLLATYGILYLQANQAPGSDINLNSSSTQGVVADNNIFAMPTTAALEFPGVVGFDANNAINVNQAVITGGGQYFSSYSNNTNFANGAWSLMPVGSRVNVGPMFSSSNLPVVEWYDNSSGIINAAYTMLGEQSAGLTGIGGPSHSGGLYSLLNYKFNGSAVQPGFVYNIIPADVAYLDQVTTVTQTVGSQGN